MAIDDRAADIERGVVTMVAVLKEVERREEAELADAIYDDPGWRLRVAEALSTALLADELAMPSQIVNGVVSMWRGKS